jgi:Zn-dependent protease with chaperone function
MQPQFPLKWVRRRVLVLLLVAVVGCSTRNIVQSPSTGRFQLQSGYNMFTPEQDIQLGRQAQADVNRTMPVLPESSPVTKYVQSLGQQLAAKAPGEVKWPFNFHVVNQKEINAFALPGGPIYVNLGTIREADDEGELVGVIAHEISHVVLRHSTEQASKATLAQLPLAVLGGVLPQTTVGQLARLGVSFGAQSVFLKYSRDAEREADLLGSQTMYDAGFDPYSMAEFFTKLEKQGGPGVPQFLSDHPNPGNRVETVREAIARYPKKSYRKNSAQFESVKSVVAKMKPMTAEQVAQYQKEHQAQGGTVGNVSAQDVIPATGFQTLDHSAFQIAYPSNWKVFGDQNSSVTIAPEAGVGQNAIAYGVMMSAFRPSQGTASLEQATQQLVEFLQRSNPQFRVEGNLQRVNVNGVSGNSVSLVGPSPIQAGGGPLAERDLVVTLPRSDGSVLFLVFIAPQRDFDRLKPAYQQMLDSLRVK